MMTGVCVCVRVRVCAVRVSCHTRFRSTLFFYFCFRKNLRASATGSQQTRQGKSRHEISQQTGKKSTSDFVYLHHFFDMFARLPDCLPFPSSAFFEKKSKNMIFFFHFSRARKKKNQNIRGKIGFRFSAPRPRRTPVGSLEEHYLI